MSKLLNNLNCIFCKYNKYNNDDNYAYACMDYIKKDNLGYPIENECNSLSNIYYDKIVRYFPFKQIENIKTKIVWEKEARYHEKMDKKYGNSALENDKIKFIWGIKSADDFCTGEVSLFTMNDIAIIYDKKKKQYVLEIETAYDFETYEEECKYLQECLSVFTKYMEDNNLRTDCYFKLFFHDPKTTLSAETIEELYINFKIFVEGFCNLKTNKRETKEDV